MDDGVLASRGMTEAVIKKSELKATRVKGRKKLNERQQHEKKKCRRLKNVNRNSGATTTKA